ncbi:MAG: SpoVR family protein [Deltaproteobacteria bacterium]|nr:SpoVR family protein [Deltaproteobacteria bacterium]
MRSHSMRWTGGLPRYLREIQDVIEGYARGYGLDFFPTFFEIVNYDEMNEIAAYGGFPTRYPHWRFGMEYDRLAKTRTYGLATIYELVINNDPCTAYLLEGNSFVDQKLVMAHVFAHCDFFKNNLWFAHTNRRMIDEMANHGSRVRGYMDRYGVDKVENFIDVCLSLDNLIDVHSPPLPRAPFREEARKDEEEELGSGDVPRLRAKSYMEHYINPPEFLDRQRERMAEENRQASRFPAEPERDVLRFLMEHAPLKAWERGVMEIIREEAYYFAPQGQTKIMNEGWATYWHSRIMTQKALSASEIVDYADHASMVTAVSGMRLNPYKLGVELYRHIEERWNKGRFGKAYDECDGMAERAAWDTGAGLGREKIFHVRRTHNDVTFMDEFLTYDFALEQKMFSFGYNRRRQRYEIESREFEEVKKKLLGQLTNMGHPVIRVVDANNRNRGELLLEHEHHGVDLDAGYARQVLTNLHKVWSRPVAVATAVEGKPVIQSFDGTDFSEEERKDA